MRSKTILAMVILLIGYIMSSPTYANTFLITFDTPPVEFQDSYSPGDHYVQGDYYMSTVNTPGHYGSIIRFNPFTQNALVPNNGTIHLGVTLFANPWLQKTDGGPFNLIGLDIAEYSEHVNWKSSVSIVGYCQDGSTLTATLALDRIFDGYGGVNDFQHYSLNWNNLIRVEFHETGFTMDNIEVLTIPEPALEVAVDIRPGSCPNPLNVRSKGKLPVAVLGTEDLDVTTIDPTSIRLAGVAPLRSGYEDVAGFIEDANDCNCTTLGPDGFLDLTLKFRTQDIVATMDEVDHGDVLELQLDGVLYDETPIEGADCVVIRGKHKHLNKADMNKDGVVNVADFAVFAQNWLQSSIVDE